MCDRFYCLGRVSNQRMRPFSCMCSRVIHRENKRFPNIFISDQEYFLKSWIFFVASSINPFLSLQLLCITAWNAYSKRNNRTEACVKSNIYCLYSLIPIHWEMVLKKFLELKQSQILKNLPRKRKKMIYYLQCVLTQTLGRVRVVIPTEYMITSFQ